MSKGVRDSLILSLLIKKGVCNIIFPSDVYPVYEKIIDRHVHRSVPSQQLPVEELLSSDMLSSHSPDNTLMILPSPVTPHGRYLSQREVEILCKWVATNPLRRIFLDCVYDYSGVPPTHLTPLLLHSQVLSAYSLSKGYLSPHLELPSASLADGSTEPERGAGLSSGAGFLHSNDPEDIQMLRVVCEQRGMRPSLPSLLMATSVLRAQPSLPQQQQRRLQREWARLAPHIRQLQPSFSPPSSGYFATLPLHYGAALQRDVLAVPGSVFSSASASVVEDDTDFGSEKIDAAPSGGGSSVISCLYYIKDLDTASPTPEEGEEEEDQGVLSAPQHMYHVTVLSNFARGFDKYSRRYDKARIAESTFPDQFFLLRATELAVGLQKAERLRLKLGLAGDELLLLHTSVPPRQLVPHPRGQFVRDSSVSVHGLSLLDRTSGGFTALSAEEATARSLAVLHPSLPPYSALAPRSVSVLPVAVGCQAKCPFCFSKGSISSETAQKPLAGGAVESVLRRAMTAGAERAVITGGGEPLMLPFPRVLELVKQCSIFPTVCLITNGFYLSQLSAADCVQALRRLDESGLTVLAVSRHAADEDDNERIMCLRTEAGRVAEAWSSGRQRGLFRRLTRMRWVCVLQEGGVSDRASLADYLDFAAATGVSEVCFKELYVSSSVESVFHDAAANRWSETHQVPLALVIDFCGENDFRKVSELPWGAPVFEGLWKGKNLRIAAYTEPSVFWERHNKMCRSWNLMADGKLMASLEDSSSHLN